MRQARGAQCLATATEGLGGEQHPATHVLIHDVGHPLATGGATDRVIAGLRAGHPVVVPVLPVTDTFKAVSDDGAVMGTVDRTELRTVQYPRGYARATLRELIVGRRRRIRRRVVGRPADRDGRR